MAQNFIECDREQLLLMSPSLREWLPENHLAWFVIDAVKDMDLSAFYARYRQDGWGRAAYDPAMMVAIVLYAYAKGQRSSRGIERACVEDVAYRVIAANLTPDHVTINRFRAEHSDALAGLFGSALTWCERGGRGGGAGGCLVGGGRGGRPLGPSGARWVPFLRPGAGGGGPGAGRSRS